MLTDSKLLTSAAWDAQSLNELKTKAGKDPAANIRPVARQVEGMFVQMMLKSMRETLPKDGMFSSDSTRLYTSMYDQQIAQQMTAGKGLGLADMIVKQTEAAQGIQPKDELQQGFHTALHQHVRSADCPANDRRKGARPGRHDCETDRSSSGAAT